MIGIAFLQLVEETHQLVYFRVRLGEVVCAEVFNAVLDVLDKEPSRWRPTDNCGIDDVTSFRAPHAVMQQVKHELQGHDITTASR